MRWSSAAFSTRSSSTSLRVKYSKSINFTLLLLLCPEDPASSAFLYPRMPPVARDTVTRVIASVQRHCMAKHMEVEMQDCQNHERIKGTETGRQLLRLIEQWKEGQRKVKDCHKLEAYSDCFKPVLQTWNINIRTQPKHPMSCTWRDDTSDCNLQLRLQKSSAKPWATESLQEIATETLQASRILLIRHISKSSLCQYLFGSLAKGILTVISLRRCSWISGKCSSRSAKDGPMGLGHCESDAFALDYGIRCVHYLRHGGKTVVTFI